MFKSITGTGIKAKKVVAATTACCLAVSALPQASLAVHDAETAQDNTYTGKAAVFTDDEESWSNYSLDLELTVKDGVIESLNYGSVGSENASYVKRAIKGTSKVKGLEEMLKGQLATYQTVETLDAVSGATCTASAVKEALKTKDPSVSTNLTFTGKYVILTTGKRKIGASSKLPKEKREKLLKIVEDFLSGKEQIPYGVIVRTNAAQASKEELLLELAQLEAEVQKIISGAKYLIRYSLVHKEEQPWQKMLNGLYETELGEVVTDDREIFETICNMYGVGAKQLVTGGSVRSRVDEILTGHGLKIRYYEDEMVSLSALSGITSQLHDALRERVWLKSGAYLIIQPTEALTVIDVNTGKNIAKKEMQENFLKVNIEAAEEIARQLRLRNISGIVIVDFINLEAKSAESELLNVFGAALKKDPVPTQIVEMTKLGLVEVTRKKIKKSLRESLS